MLVIRLSRTGRNKYPTYRIVAADSKRAATGKFVMILGHYNPHTKELVIKKEETVKYLSTGAQPSNAVIKLLKQDKIDVPEWAVLKTRNRPAKKAVVEKPAVAISTDEPASESTETVTAEEAIKEAAVAPESVAEVAAKEVAAVTEKAPVDNEAVTAEAEATETETAKERQEDVDKTAVDDAASTEPAAE